MSRYARVETHFWQDQKIRDLTEDARTLFLYLLTCPHGNMCGIFYLPELYAASDLQWEPIRYRKGIDTLSKGYRIAIDGSVIWLKNHVKHNTPVGQKQIIGFVNALEKVPENNLIKDFVENLSKYLSEQDYKLFNELYKIPHQYTIEGVSDTLCHTPSITDPDTDTVTDTGSDTDPVEPLALVAEKSATIPYQQIVDLYHENCPSLPKIMKLNANRKTLAKARCNEHGLQGLETLFKKAEASDFLSGRNGNWTSCNFDWLLKDNNCLKTLEGNYDNKFGGSTEQESAVERRLRELEAEEGYIDADWSESYD